MTELTWKNWTPQYDGHAPDDWDNCTCEFKQRGTRYWIRVRWPGWLSSMEYRYHAKPTQDATHEPDLLAQCLALPQADRDALIEALQRPMLLPCPFCGNDGRGPIEEALHVCHSEQEDNAHYDCYNVQCDRCTATMGYSESEEQAIAAWNRRDL